MVDNDWLYINWNMFRYFKTVAVLLNFCVYRVRVSKKCLMQMWLQISNPYFLKSLDWNKNTYKMERDKSTNAIRTYKWDKVFKSGLSKFCERQPLKNLKGYGLLKRYGLPSNFLNAVIQKIYLVHSWILCFKCHCDLDVPIFSAMKYYITYNLSYNLIPAISRVLVGRYLIFCSSTWPTRCNSPRKSMPVKCKTRQKAGLRKKEGKKENIRVQQYCSGYLWVCVLLLLWMVIS